MLIGFDMPAVTNVALADGTWLTADEGAALFDGRPRRAARIARSGTVTLTLTLGAAMVPGIVALLGLNVAPGTAITAAGASGTARRLADGSVACYLLPGGDTPTSSVVVTVAGDAMLEIGELAVMRRTRVHITADWAVLPIAPRLHDRDRGSQLATQPRVPYRQLRTTMSIADDSTVRGGALDGGMDWDQLDAALANDRRCIAIPRYSVSGTPDMTLLHRTALYGIASEIGETRHVRGPWYSKAITFEEVPA